MLQKKKRKENFLFGRTLSLRERAASLIRKGNGKGPNVNEERAWEALLLKGCTRFFLNFPESLSQRTLNR